MPAELPDGGVDALEYVLALDTAAERRRFEAALLDDPRLTAAVWAAEERMRPLADAVRDVPPRRRVFAAVEQRLFGREALAGRQARRAARFWRGLAAVFGIATAAAAAVIVVVAMRPDLVSPDGAMFVAAIKRSDGAITLARLRPDGRLVAQPFPVADAGSPELWLVREGTAPVSLGLLAPTARSELPLPRAERAEFAEGALLVITLEPQGGSPTGAPTGPQLGLGPLSQI